MPSELQSQTWERDAVRDVLADGALGMFFTDRRVRWIGSEQAADGPAEEAEVLVAYRRLQDLADYRAAIRAWFDRVGPKGYLVIVVPHAFLHERRLSLPSPWRPRQRRLYTPASLLAEVEEALPPNHYRVRWAGDLDRGYDYGQTSGEPRGESDAAIVLEPISPPAWRLDEPANPLVADDVLTREFAFEPPRTRVEVDVRPRIRRLLILKLDHLGDLIMGTPALRRARRYFPDALIDLVVGTWNVDMARDLGVADRVIGFDAFPRNSSEEEANVVATLGQFRALVTESYDLAIDLRADIDTRVLLQSVDAPIKAAIGTRARFPFLQIALPLDSTRNEAERVLDVRLAPHAFAMQGSGQRSHFGLRSDKHSVERDCAIIWGPYLELAPGDYIFDFFIDLEPTRGDGLLRLDIALDRGRVVSEMFVSGPSNFHLPFRVDHDRTVFEARIFTVEGHPSISFGFHGGRLIKQGPGNVLHQTEYAALLIELVKLRVQDYGMAEDIAAS